MKQLNKNRIKEIQKYALEHTVKECSVHFNIPYDNIQTFMARHRIKHKKRKSCGKNNNNYKIGFAMNKKLYWVYYAMLQRCYNKRSPAYKNYGARGISVCEEWKQDNKSFYSWAMLNGYKEGLTLDRLNNNGNYCPSNCSWVSNKTNCNHTRKVHFLTYKGKTQSMSAWAEELNINYSTLRNRINRSLQSIEEILGGKDYGKNGGGVGLRNK